MKANTTVKIVFVHGHMFSAHTWSQVYDLLKGDGIELHIFSQHQSAEQALALLENREVDVFIGQLFRDLPWHDELIAGSEKARHRMGLGWDMPQHFSTFTPNQEARFASYMRGISANNYFNGIKFLISCTGKEVLYETPEPVRTHGVYHPDAPSLFDSVASYVEWQQARGVEEPGKPLVGILCSYGQIAERNCHEIDTLMRTLEKHEFRPLCVYCEGMADSTLPADRRYSWLAYLQEAGSDLKLILNMLIGRLVSQPEDVSILQGFDVPVIQIVRSYAQGPEDWKADFGGLGAGSQNMVFSLTQPEMSGSIEPTLVACTVPDTDDRSGLDFRRYVPVEERIEHLCRRLKRWMRLKELSNAEKRLTIILHNNPCKGVEATLGLAEGLDTFESLASLVRALRQAGYNVGDMPDNGSSILNLILDRKAISEFRWTTTDEIVNKGGVLHQTTRDEYESLLAALPARARDRILADWGAFPGEAMVYKDNHGNDTLLVTGLRFGNLQIVVQPKRGCYGAKCNGEVCRILHDPELSPPHNWLATYRYIRDTSDVVLHFGAHGSLEFLPGKRVALSENCFPEISLDDLPNVYLYVMDASADGLIAKRRGRAVMVDHLTPVQRPAELDTETLQLEQLLDQYQKARENNETRRTSVVQQQMLPLMKSLNFVDQAYDGDQFDEKVTLLSRQVARCKRALTHQGMHRLGESPTPEGIATMLATVLLNPSDELPSVEEIATWAGGSSSSSFDAVRDVIRPLMEGERSADCHAPDAARLEGLKHWCLDMGDRIAMSTREIPQLLKALDGGFIEPGLSGSLSQGKTQALPTGRNFYTSDVLAMPTRAAWQVGKQLADNLLRKFLKDEGRFPEGVGMSLWSLDAFKSDGEVFCQILHLMGMRPVWGQTGRVSRIEPIELDDLALEVDGVQTIPRPRVDVIIQTSCILRDTVPHFADLVDEAAVTAGELDEPLERNFIRKHTQERLAELQEELEERFPESELKRMASFRVFSSAPGTYGTGVGLALDASAWETDEDLAETYVNWSGYAYGSDRCGQFSRVSGMEAHKLYAGNLKTLDVTYLRQYAPDYDLVDCGCYTGSLGGMSVAAKAVSGKRARIYWSDSNVQGDLSVRDLKEDLAASVRTKLFNRNWIKHQKGHGYKGASEVSSRVNNLFKWSATTHEVDKWMFDGVVETYIHDQENLEWLRENNPYALEEVTRRLLEAHSRGLWEADPDILKHVQEAALLIEGDMEEIIGEVREDFQGAKVDVMTAKDVEKWHHKWKIERVRS